MRTMSGLDARFLFSETAAAHMHTIKVAVVDVSARSSALTPERLAAALEARLARMPVLRRRVVPVPHGLGNPVLVDDPDFDLRDHLHYTSAAAPGEARELGAIVARIAAVPLARDRPLWDLTVVEGLAGGQVGFIVKIHHSLADGSAAVALLLNAFVADDAQADVEPFRLEALPSSWDLYRMTAPTALRALGSIPSLAVETVRGLRRERAVRRQEPEPVLGPFAGPRTRFNVALTPERTFATLTLSLDALSAARHLEGASLNDAFLAVCAGGLRRYLRRTGDLPRKSLVASVPMATPSEGDRLSGNHVDNLFVPLHTEIDDVVARIRAIHASASAARRARAALGTGLFERRATLVPPVLYNATARSWAATGLADRVRPPLNLVASCVEGPRTPLELDGGTITALYSSGPILEGIGLNITAWSYLDTLYVSLLGCPASLPDPWRLAEDIGLEMATLPQSGPVRTRRDLVPYRLRSTRRTISAHTTTAKAVLFVEAMSPASPESEPDDRGETGGGRAWWSPACVMDPAVGAYRAVEKRLARQPLARLATALPRTVRWIGNEWGGGDQTPGLPVTRVTPSLVGHVVMDESIMALAIGPNRFPRRADYERVGEEMGRAHTLFEARGWLDDPASFHEAPDPLTDPAVSRGWALGRSYERLWWPSGYEPHPGVPGSERWRAFESNRTASAWLLRHPGRDRPWVVCIHGFGTGSVFMDLVSFHAGHLHDDLGVNVAAIVLPLHGARKANRMSGEEFLGFEMMNSVHGLTQSLWDIRRLLGWVRQQDPSGLGVFGVSLGGLLTALTAAFEPDLDLALAGIPMIDFPDLIRHHAPYHLHMRSIEHHILDGTAQDVHRVVSPLAMPTAVAPEARAIFAGLGDRLAPPEHARRLWAHWGEPETRWFPGNHVGYLWSGKVWDFVDQALATRGLVG